MKKISWFTKKSYWQQDIKKREYFLAFLNGNALIILISILFYQSFALGILLSPLSIIYVQYWKQQCIKQKQQNFQQQFKEAMQMLATALRTGYSIENAMRETLKDIRLVYKPEVRIVQELIYMNRQLDMHFPVEQIWQEFSERVEQEDVRNFTVVFMIAKRGGGNMIAILCSTISNMSDKVEIKREIYTIIAKKRFEFRIMSLIPFAMIGYMYISFPEFMNVLYKNILGVVIMSMCLFLYMVGYFIGKRIIEIEV